MKHDSTSIIALVDMIERERRLDNFVTISTVRSYTDIDQINKRMKEGMTLEQALNYAEFIEKLYISKPQDGEPH
tara:strand:+ start:155 stop:376 length:222 start_codon:yes stop_codon:yes gene_type:complete